MEREGTCLQSQSREESRCNDFTFHSKAARGHDTSHLPHEASGAREAKEQPKVMELVKRANDNRKRNDNFF